MKCVKCGKDIPKGSMFCPNCGTSVLKKDRNEKVFPVKMITCGFLGIFVIIVLTVLLLRPKYKTLDLAEYTNFHFSGYNKYASFTFRTYSDVKDEETDEDDEDYDDDGLFKYKKIIDDFDTGYDFHFAELLETIAVDTSDHGQKKIIKTGIKLPSILRYRKGQKKR